MNVYLSVVIPVFNEAENVAPLAAELAALFDGLGKSAEAVWVDDGSRDNSFSLITALSEKDRRMRGIRLGRNFGQTAALSAGIAAARGEVIALLDGDGQNDPADIPKLLARLEQGFDVVSGWRKNRKDAFFSRVLPSRLANWLISAATGTKLHDYGCTLKVYRSQALRSFKIYGEMHRFLPAFAAAAGASIAEEEVNHRARAGGASKYGLGRTFKVLLDLATVKFMGNYLSKPIYLFGGLALGCGSAAFVCAAATLYNKFANQVFVKDQPLFLVAIFLGLVSVQLLLLGLLSEIISRIYYEINGRPPYAVKVTTRD